jgi:hypothetical protein
MGVSAFEILIVPVFLGTLGSCIAGAAIRALMIAIEAFVGRLGRTARSFKTVPGAARDSLRRAHRPVAHGVGSIGRA